MQELTYKQIKKIIDNTVHKQTKKLSVDKNKPILVVFDSANNTGKTTIVSELEKRMLENGFRVKCLKQPYYPENRKVLLSGDLDYLEEYELFYKDRLNLLVKEIWKSSYDIILLDRSFVSSIYYQGILHKDLNNITEIISDSIDLYDQLDLKIDIGVNMYANPSIMSDRFKNSTDTEYDYRDDDDINKIQNELDGYNIAWEIAVDSGLVDLLYTVRNNDISDMMNIIDTLDELIADKIKRRDCNKLSSEEEERLEEYLD